MSFRVQPTNMVGNKITLNGNVSEIDFKTCLLAAGVKLNIGDFYTLTHIEEINTTILH